jgi:hypothetical protein
MQSLQDELQGLPKSLEDNPQAELWSLCMAFVKAVDEFASGNPHTQNAEKKSFLQLCRPLYLLFQEDVIRTQPKFQVSHYKADSGEDCSDQGRFLVYLLLIFQEFCLRM